MKYYHIIPLMAALAMPATLPAQKLDNKGRGAYFIAASDTVRLKCESYFTTVPVAANCDIKAESNSSWLKIKKLKKNKLTLEADRNISTQGNRKAIVKLTSADGSFVRDITVIQELNNEVSEEIDRLNNDAFLNAYRQVLTAGWSAPFAYEDIKSQAAPKGPYLGNGDIGAVAFTAGNSQTLMLSKVDFVTDCWNDWAGSGAAASSLGGVSVTVASAATTGGFHYEMNQIDAELHMTTATESPVKMTTRMGMEENIVLVGLSTGSTAPVPVNVVTYTNNTTAGFTNTAGVNGNIGFATRRTISEGAKWICQAGISTRVIGAEATVERLSSHSVQHSFNLSAASDTVWVAVYVSGGGKGDNARLGEAYVQLKDMNKNKVADIDARRRAWWHDMWTRSYVETGDELVNRHYHSSVYLLASGYNRHSPVSGGMYGVWNMEDNMMYHGDIHLNYNSQAGFYSMFSCNRPELATPFYKSIELLIPEGKRRAQEDLASVHASLTGKKCRGILFPVAALGIGEFYRGSYWMQTVNAPFCMPLFKWYYDYTLDEDFLREHAYPYMRLIGDFYEDYLVKENYGDSYRYSITTGAHEDSWDLNPPSDLAFVEQCFRGLLRYSQVLGVDAAKRAFWNDIVTHLPEYKVIMPTKTPNEGLPVYAKNENGWDHPNHAIQLHPIYPCEVLDLHSDPEKLQLARNTLHYYEVSQNGFTGCMNELGLSAFVMGARVGFDPHILMDKMKVIIQSAGKNFLVNDGHHCAEKTTVIETVNSMMLQTVDDILHLFPNWIGQPASFTRLRAKGAFIVSAATDGKRVLRLQIKSEKGGTCRLEGPWGTRKLKVTANGQSVAVTQKGEVCSFETEAGVTYKVENM